MIFELLFVGLFLASCMTLIGILVLAIRGARRTAMQTLRVLGVGWAVYLLIVVVVAAATASRPQQVIPMGEERCFDEMCFSVVDVQTVAQLGTANAPVKAGGVFYVVTVRASSRSRGRAQREGGLRALLWDSGKYYETSPGGQSAWEAANGETSKLTARLQPGQSVESVQVFDVPSDLPKESSAPGLVLSHGFTPGYFVIGESPLFHAPAIFRLSR